MKAEQFLRNGADVLAERGKEYDKPEGERSMARCVAAFNAITGKDLTEAEGWALMALLKMVRQWQNPDRYHEDSAVDGVNYAALMAEALSEQKPENAAESGPNILLPSMFDEENNGKPDWKDAPEWAEVLVKNKSSGVYEFAYKLEKYAAITQNLLDTGSQMPANPEIWYSFVELRP